MICVDASVGVKWIFPEEHSAEALNLVRDAAHRRERVIAPHLFQLEANNTIRQRMRREGFPIEQGRRLLANLRAFPVTILPASPQQRDRLHEHALELAARFDLPAIYDEYYLALADLRECPLWTSDRKLINAVGDGFPAVRWIGDYVGQ